MTPEDKQLISKYMGWSGKTILAVSPEDCKTNGLYTIYNRNFDSNDASMCVEKMAEKGDWEAFEDCMADIFLYDFELECICDNHARYIAWLFNPDNFFSAMASWLRGKQYTPSIRTR